MTKRINDSKITGMILRNVPIEYREDIRKATRLLKSEGGKSVYLFGSVVTGKTHARSDIDIGVKGLPPEKFFKTYSKLYTGFDNEINLVDFDRDDSLFALLEKCDEVVEIG